MQLTLLEAAREECNWCPPWFRVAAIACSDASVSIVKECNIDLEIGELA